MVWTWGIYQVAFGDLWSATKKNSEESQWDNTEYWLDFNDVGLCRNKTAGEDARREFTSFGGRTKSKMEEKIFVWAPDASG